MYQMMGASMVIVGCAYWGWLKGFELNEKLRLTEEFIRSLEIIKREISDKHRLLPHIMADLSRKEKNITSEYFRILTQKISPETQSSFSLGWAQSMMADLPVELWKILSPLGQVLGQFDGKTQGEALDSVLQDLRQFKVQQAEENLKKVKVYGAFGVTSGIFLVILFI